MVFFWSPNGVYLVPRREMVFIWSPNGVFLVPRPPCMWVRYVALSLWVRSSQKELFWFPEGIRSSCDPQMLFVGARFAGSALLSICVFASSDFGLWLSASASFGVSRSTGFRVFVFRAIRSPRVVESLDLQVTLSFVFRVSKSLGLKFPGLKSAVLCLCEQSACLVFAGVRVCGFLVVGSAALWVPGFLEQGLICSFSVQLFSTRLNLTSRS